MADYIYFENGAVAADTAAGRYAWVPADAQIYPRGEAPRPTVFFNTAGFVEVAQDCESSTGAIRVRMLSGVNEGMPEPGNSKQFVHPSWLTVFEPDARVYTTEDRTPGLEPYTSDEKLVKLRAELDRAKAALESMTADHRHSLARAERAEDDLRIIADALRQEAISRSWCSEYGEFIDDVNRQTYGTWLEHCKSTYTVRQTVIIEYEVEAENESQAEDDADAELRRDLRSLSVSWTHESTDVEEA